ncbi:Glycine cleavage system H protein [wastewater metagenome]|uniref:Glycine cleavage system H protein n=2 Tax=unclassified sequences TaxID=12908 RepID=A0A5B8RBK6_9ZZZZ|nr:MULTISPECIES: glycine cleavage system protein GcvH [Arhodomonas]MCS4502949.1 glycine cleavage system protein GcvH [Arhodomonas aquaeolei]QEA06180.1 glycine cleavage system H protein [uncultured organism]
MSNIPTELKYTRSHEWVRTEDDGTVTVGITDHAQESLGDLVFVELPEPGGVDSEATVAVVESVKAASDIYSPLAGEITEANERLADEPELINQDPYGEGWLFRMRPADEGAVDALLDAAAYTEFAAEE